MHKLLRLFADGKMPEKIEMCREAGLLQHIMPELHACIGIDGGGYHDETVYEHLLSALEAAKSYPPLLQLAVLLHDIGKPGSMEKKDGKISFHSHEVNGATEAYQFCKRTELSKNETKHVVKLVRWHMFRFDTNSTDKTIKRWLFKIGKGTWEDLFRLRIADRRGNKTNENKPSVTREMKALDKKIQVLISSGTILFKEDLNISEDQLKKIIGRQHNLHEVYTNLIGLVNSDLSRNNLAWLTEYIKRVYPCNS